MNDEALKKAIERQDSTTYLKLDQCKKGFIYDISSRNLGVGVFNGETGFIGIREKFGSEYLFTEYHWDTGEPFGTVKPHKEVGELPKEIIASETLEDGSDNQALFDYLEKTYR